MRPLLALLSLLHLPLVAFAGNTPPNLLVLIADDVGVDSVACYGEGNDVPNTPNIDALAANGVLFRNAWGHPSCSPARAAMQTGRFAFRTGVGAPVVNNGHGLPLSEVTLPELFDLHPALGYSHAFFGKWHLGTAAVGGELAPNLAGWGHYAGALNNLNEPYHYFHWPLVVDGATQIEQGYITTRTVDMALDWIASVPEPWVCFVSFHAAHFPYHAPPAHLHSVALPDVDPREAPRPFYRAIVEAMDSETGRLLASLGEQRQRTMVVLASDNGTTKEVVVPPFSPLRAKLTPYEGGINVPLIVSGPLVAQPGRESADLVCLADLYATLAAMAGIDAAAALPGVALDARSFLPALTDANAPAARDFEYSEHSAPNGFTPDKSIRVVRGERYKLILQDVPIEQAELYDLWRDPFELENLLARPLMSHEVRTNYLDLRRTLDQLVP